MLGFKKKFSILVMLSTLGYALSFGNQLVISYYFGTNSSLDAYWAALGIANFLCFYLHPLKEALVPATFRSSKISNEEASQILSAGLMLLSFLALISVTLMLFAQDFLVQWLVNKQDVNQQLQTLLPWFIPFLFLFIFSETLSSILLGFNKNLTQATARLIAGIASLLTLLAFSKQLGIHAMIIGLLVNQFVVLLISIWSLKSFQFKLKLTSISILKQEGVHKLFSTLFLTYLIAQFYVLIERKVMLQFSSGLLSSYQYSSSLVNVLLSMLAFPFANLLWHKFLEANHSNSEIVAKTILLKALLVLLLILLPICAYAYMNAQSIIFLIYSRGEFNAESLNMTTEGFKSTIFTAIPIGLSSVIGRYLISTQQSKSIAITGLSSAIISISIIMLSSHLDNVHLLLWNWFLGNLIGLFIYSKLALKDLSINLEKIYSGIIFTLHIILVVAATAYLVPDFAAIRSSKIDTFIRLCFNFICFSVILVSLSKITGIIRKVESLISSNAT